MADEERKARRLQVATMRPEDSGRGIARLPRALMTEMGLAEGDVIELSGKRVTPARAVGPYPEDEGLEIIRLDGGQRGEALHRLIPFEPRPSCAVHIFSLPCRQTENRSFMRAYSALAASLFALAQKLCKRKKDPAFQASSPKTFRGRSSDRPLFSWPAV